MFITTGRKAISLLLITFQFSKTFQHESVSTGGVDVLCYGAWLSTMCLSPAQNYQQRHVTL
jgi:hypothetical protein